MTSAPTLPGKAQHEDTSLPASFVGKTGRFYVLVPSPAAPSSVPRRYAVRNSVAAYDQRSGLPDFVPAPVALADFDHAVKIYPETLTTTPPPAPDGWKDETDLGLTPQHFTWKQRLDAAKEARRRAA